MSDFIYLTLEDSRCLCVRPESIVALCERTGNRRGCAVSTTNSLPGEDYLVVESLSVIIDRLSDMKKPATNDL